MTTALSPELYWLTATAVLTALLWLPYILSLLGQMGVGPALMDGEHATPLKATWAQRAKRAHTNAVENLVVFAPLAIGVHITGVGTELTAMAAMVFFWARLGHFVVYTLGLPVVRTLLFFIGFVAQLILGLTLLGLI